MQLVSKGLKYLALFYLNLLWTTFFKNNNNNNKELQKVFFLKSVKKKFSSYKNNLHNLSRITYPLLLTEFQWDKV